MEKLKEQLVKRLHRHLEEHLDRSVQASVSTQNRMEILHCVVDWVYRDSEMLERIRKAKVVSEALKKKRGTLAEKEQALSEPEFMDELEKL